MDMEDSTPIYIYALCDPYTDEPRYIGQTKTLVTRYRTHLTEQVNKAKVVWMESLLSAGQLPHIAVLAVVSPQIADEMEAFWIWKYRVSGAVLLNATFRAPYHRAYRTGPYGRIEFAA